MAIDYTSTGINFADLANYGGTANEFLDDYEEGTFAPAVLNYGYSLNALSGHYVVLGKLVTGSLSMNVSSGGSDNSHFFISGLPFNSEDTSYDRFGGYFTRIGNQGVTSNLSTTFLHKQNNNAYLVAYTSAGDGSYNQMGFATTGQNIGVAYSYFKAT